MTYVLHTPRHRATITPGILSRVLFTFAALLAVAFTPRPAAPVVIRPWSERSPEEIADQEWADAIRRMAHRMAPHHRAR